MTPKERIWFAAYFGEARYSATKAARVAGYAHPDVQGPRKSKKFAKEIEERMNERIMSAEEVQVRLTEQAEADISDFIQAGGAINWQAVAEKGWLIKSIKHTLGKNSEITLHDSQRALDMMGKAHGIFKDRHVHEGSLVVEGLEEMLEKAYGDSNSDTDEDNDSSRQDS